MCDGDGARRRQDSRLDKPPLYRIPPNPTAQPAPWHPAVAKHSPQALDDIVRGLGHQGEFDESTRLRRSEVRPMMGAQVVVRSALCVAATPKLRGRTHCGRFAKINERARMTHTLAGSRGFDESNRHR